MADISKFLTTKQVSILKRRIGGLRTPVNEKIGAAPRLATLAIGPPVLNAPIISKQLNFKLKEIDAAYDRLKANVNSIINLLINLVEVSDDTAKFDDDNDKLTTITAELVVKNISENEDGDLTRNTKSLF